MAVVIVVVLAAAPGLVLLAGVVEGELAVAFGLRAAVEEEFRVDAAVGGGGDGAVPGAFPYGGEQLRQLRGGDAVGLVEDDEVGGGEVPVQLGVAFAGRLVLGGVDHLDEAAVADVRVLAGQDHADQFDRFGQAAGLDDDDVEAYRDG